MIATVPIFFGWLWTVASCYAAGIVLLRFLSVDLYREETHFFRFIAGSACFSLIIFGLTAAHLAYASVFLALGLIIIALAIRFDARSTPSVALPDFSWSWKAIFLSALAVYGAFYFLHALAPETSPDGSTYHLGIVARYLRQHSFGRITTDMYANLSEGVEMLFLPAFSFGRHSAAALVEFTFLLALPFGMLSYGRRIGQPKAGVLAALIVFASPVFGMSGTVAYNDAAGVAILFALFYLLQIWGVTRQQRLIPLIGLLAGFCYSAKYTLFLAVPYAGLYLLWTLVKARERFLRPLLVFSAVALLSIAPWMAKNWITVRNPFSPFANRLFTNPYITVHFEQEYGELMRNREGLTARQRPLDHVLLGERTSGLLGPVFLLAPLALLALRVRPGKQVLLATVIFLVPALANVETRFLMPMAPFLAMALGIVVAQVPGGIPIVLAFHLITAWPTFLRSYSNQNTWALEHVYPSEAFRLIPESTTLRTRMPPYEIAEMLDKETPPGSRVFSFSNPPEAYTSREILVKYESALGNRLGECLYTALIPDYQPSQTLTFTFPSESLLGVRVVQTANQAKDLWTISEFRLRSDSAEVPYQPSWKLSASANPWDLPLAFDGNLDTRWSTMEAIRPGMKVELQFDHPQSIGQVLLDGAVEWGVQLKLEGERTLGVWQPIGTTAVRQPRALSELRHAATSEMKRCGLSHILIASDDFGADDFFSKQTAWNIRFLGEAQGSRLYKLL